MDSLELKWIKNEIGADTYHKWHDEFSQKLLLLKQETFQLRQGENEIKFLLDQELHKLSNLEYIYSSATISQGQELLRRVFDNRLYYQRSLYRTPYMMSIFHHSILILSEKELSEMDKNEETGLEVRLGGGYRSRTGDLLHAMQAGALGRIGWYAQARMPEIS